jgi:hypothetical protein
MNRGISSVRSAARRPVANNTGSRARTSTSSASRARRAA